MGSYHRMPSSWWWWESCRLSGGAVAVRAAGVRATGTRRRKTARGAMAEARAPPAGASPQRTATVVGRRRSRTTNSSLAAGGEGERLASASAEAVAAADREAGRRGLQGAVAGAAAASSGVAASSEVAGGGRWADRGRRRGCRVPGKATVNTGLLLAAAGAAAATRGRRGWRREEGEHPPRPACLHLHPSSSTPSGWARAVRPCCLTLALTCPSCLCVAASSAQG